MSVRRGDGSDEAAAYAAEAAQFQAGTRAYQDRKPYLGTATSAWRDGWIHGAELAQERAGIVRHLPLIRQALSGAFVLIRNAPAPAKPLGFAQRKARDEALTSINLALAHVGESLEPAPRPEPAAAEPGEWR